MLSVSFGLEMDDESVLMLSVEPVVVAEVRFEHRCRRALTAVRILILSPTLVMPICLSTCWSKSSRASPRMSFCLKVSATFAHLASVNHCAMCASDQVEMKAR